jgi:hypothetical protein
MRFLITPIVAALPFLAAAQEQALPRYSLKQQVPDLGTHIKREVVTGSGIPFDKRYAELSTAQRELLKRQYERMGANDEPPFPLNGLGPIYKALSDAQAKLMVQGPMTLFVDVDSTGQATAVSVLKSPDPAMTKYAVAVLMQEQYKPAICDGAPCRMQFPFRMDFKTRYR